MRSIHTHECTHDDKKIGITAMDEPEAGGANNYYAIDCDGSEFLGVDIHFQSGPVAEAGGINGITIESLVAICIDRLQCCQRGPLLCREYALAITHLEESMLWLHKRTRDRIARGVDRSLG